MDPRESGLALETLIGASVKALGVKHLSESEIKTELGDSTMNGVDHWITYKSAHILIQTKWRDTTTQPEVAQFLACVDRIQTRIPTEESVFLLWACKTEPTKNATAVLVERNVAIVSCGVSIESLARNVLCWVAESYGLDPAPGFCEIPVRLVPRIATGMPRGTPVATPNAPPAPKIVFDETDDGKRAILNAQQFITSLHQTIGRRIQNSLSCGGLMDTMSIVNAGFPQKVEDWWSGTITKVNFNSILRALKGICVPTKTKNFQSRSLFVYCKMRYISTELAGQVAGYMALRTKMIGDGSSWAKKMPMLICTPEPMTQEEFKACVVHCADYWMHVNRAGVIEKVPSGIENQFFMNYYAN
jgi:hypothetical protein